MTDWLTDFLGCGKWTLKVSILPQLCETIKSFIGRHWLSVTLFMAQISPVIKKDFLSCSALKINGNLFPLSTIHAIHASCTCIPPVKTTSWTDRIEKEEVSVKLSHTGLAFQTHRWIGWPCCVVELQSGCWWAAGSRERCASWQSCLMISIWKRYKVFFFSSRRWRKRCNACPLAPAEFLLNMKQFFWINLCVVFFRAARNRCLIYLSPLQMDENLVFCTQYKSGIFDISLRISRARWSSSHTSAERHRRVRVCTHSSSCRPSLLEVCVLFRHRSPRILWLPLVHAAHCWERKQVFFCLFTLLIWTQVQLQHHSSRNANNNRLFLSIPSMFCQKKCAKWTDHWGIPIILSLY